MVDIIENEDGTITGGLLVYVTGVGWGTMCDDNVDGQPSFA